MFPTVPRRVCEAVVPPVPPNPPTRVIVGFRAEAPIETLKKYPKDSTALLQRATLEINEGDLGAATADLATLQGMKIFSAALTFQESRIFAARHETAREGDLLAEALHTDPHYLPARLSLAELLVAQGKARNALVILDQADTGQKKSVEYIYSRNMALLATRDWDEARKGVDEGLALRRLPGFYYQDAAHGRMGSCMTKVLPRPGPSLSAQARPPWRLATERTMYSPRPVPLTRVAPGPWMR